MNKENLIRMRDHLKTVKESQFDMRDYRLSELSLGETQCKSVGCVVGHCTILDNKNINKNHICDGMIDFFGWSREFTGCKGDLWMFMFSGFWIRIDNTLSGAIKRIDYVIDNGSEMILSIDPDKGNLYEEWFKLYNK